jgi:hypothetical protein
VGRSATPSSPSPSRATSPHAAYAFTTSCEQADTLVTVTDHHRTAGTKLHDGRDDVAVIVTPVISAHLANAA